MSNFRENYEPSVEEGINGLANIAVSNVLAYTYTSKFFGREGYADKVNNYYNSF